MELVIIHKKCTEIFTYFKIKQSQVLKGFSPQTCEILFYGNTADGNESNLKVDTQHFDITRVVERSFEVRFAWLYRA